MITSILSALLVVSAVPDSLIPVIGYSDVQAPAPGVRLILNHQEFGTSAPVKVQVETDEDGYLLVMRVDGDGRIRVIFPLDPTGDPFVRGGKLYELRGRAESETFRADDQGGAGIVFAALSRDPLNFRDYSQAGHWDYETLRVTEFRDDPEAELHRFVRLMSNQGKYSFDVKGYRVVVAPANDYYVATSGGYYGGFNNYDYCGGGFGRRYSSGFGISFGVSRSYAYDPFAYGSYGCDSFFYDPYFAYTASPWYSPFYPGQYAPYTVYNFNRPRPPINSHLGERARPRPSLLAPHIGHIGLADAPVVTPAAPVTRPSNNDGRARPRQDGAGGSAQGGGTGAPPAVRPASNSRPPTTQSTAGSNSRGATSSTGNTRARPGNDVSVAGRPADRSATQALTPPATVTQRLDGPRPVFRVPPPTSSTAQSVEHRAPPSEQRPVYRQPDHPTTTARPPQSTGETRRPEPRPAPTVTRTSPPPPPPPPPASTRSSSPPPPPPPPATSGNTRARASTGGG